jgi:hypothetical protein
MCVVLMRFCFIISSYSSAECWVVNHKTVHDLPPIKSFLIHHLLIIFLFNLMLITIADETVLLT